ncbi:MAG: DEAD/DEAH box helicase [Rikenellaceae bacterium]
MMIKTEDILKRFNIETLTPMQQSVLSSHKEQQNLQILSPTGSGKTLAYTLASFERLKDMESSNTEIIIIAPTRELVIQIGEVIKKCGTQFKSATLYGGRKITFENDILKGNPKIIIATPGRLADHIRRENIDTENIHHLVIDEFDKCVEMGFDDDLIEVFSAMQSLETRILTSATDSTEIPKYVGFRSPHVIDFTADKAPLEEGNIATQIIETSAPPLSTLYGLLSTLEPLPTLVFCNYRESCERVYEYLKERGVVCDFYHGAQEQFIRERALLKLRIGAINILIATDIAARGLDINSLGYVIHYEQPQTPESFVHRSGRTGRMNGKGENYIITRSFDLLPDYIRKNGTVIEPLQGSKIYEPKNSMLYIGAGRKEKISKGDIVGFLTQKCSLPPSQIGTIQISDRESYVAISRSSAERVEKVARGQKVKKTKPIIRIIR